MATVTFASPDRFRVRDSAMKFAVICRDGAGALDAARTCTLAIQRTSDDKWWNVVGGTWDVAPVNNAMTEVSDANLPGLHELTVDHTVLWTGVAADSEATLRLRATTDAGDVDIAVVRVQHWLDTHPVTDDEITALPAAQQLGPALRVLRAMLLNKTIMDDGEKQYILFKDDGTTTLLAFDAEDGAGQPSVREIFSLEPTV